MAVIYTYSGRYVNPLALQADDIVIEDIAHALACLNRFAGHVRCPISVAQHSVYVSVLSDGPDQMKGLLHDAAEAYLGEVTKWLKQSGAMAGYREAEDRAQTAIYRRFGLSMPVKPPSVEKADKLMVRYEGARGYHDKWLPGGPKGVAGYPALTTGEMDLVGRWRFMDWAEAERMFLDRYLMLR